MKIHNDEKQHVCSLCSKRFRESRHLRYHLRMHHHMTVETEIDELMAESPDVKVETESPDVKVEAESPDGKAEAESPMN